MKINQLTFTRFLAAISIVIFHAKSNIYPFNLPFLHTIFNNANVGVSYFFILSGFVMIIAYGKDKSIKIDPPSYYINRFARIYPLYFFGLFLAVMLSIKGHGLSPSNFLLQLFALQSWVPGSVLELNAPGWSLSVEALFYISFPFIFNYIYRKSSFRLIFISAIGLWITTQIIVNYLYLSSFYKGYPSKAHDFLFYFPLMHINEFVIGNFLGFIYLKFNNIRRNFDLLIIAIFALMLFLLSLDTVINYHDGLMAICFMPLISTAFSNKHLILLGEASYSIYILQNPIKGLIYFLFKKLHVNNENLMFYTYLLLLIMISISCYYFIEVPAKNWLKNLKVFKAEKRKLKPADDKVNF